MRQLTGLITLFSLLCLLAGSSSAGSEQQDIEPQQLYGSGTASEVVPDKGTVETLFVINRDATFSGSLAVNGEPVWHYSAASWISTRVPVATRSNSWITSVLRILMQPCEDGMPMGCSSGQPWM